MIQAPITIKKPLSSNLRLNIGLIPQFDFYKEVKGYGKTSDSTGDLYSVEFNPGIEYAFSRVSLHLGFRGFQLKRIDPVYHYGGVFLRQNPGYLERTFDTHNPVKVIFSVAYKID